MASETFDCSIKSILCSRELNIYIDAIQVCHDLRKSKTDRSNLVQFIARSARINYHNQIYSELKEYFEDEMMLDIFNELLLNEIIETKNY